MEGKEFRKTDVFVAKRKDLKIEGKGNKPNAARKLTDKEVDIQCSANVYSVALRLRPSLTLCG